VTGKRGVCSLSRRIGSLGLLAAGSVLLVATPAPAATSSSMSGTATIAAPGATAAAALSSGGARTPFTVALPANAACPGDTTHLGYHVYSYLVPAGTNLASVTFVNFPSKGYGLVNGYGKYYGAINTAENTGQIIGIPNDFEWGPLVMSDGGRIPIASLLGGSNHGVWEAGIACANTHGALAARWNTQVTFSSGTQSANGLSWKATPRMASVAMGAHAGQSHINPSQHSPTAETSQSPSARLEKSAANVVGVSAHAAGAHNAEAHRAGGYSAGSHGAAANAPGDKSTDSHGQARATHPGEGGTVGGTAELPDTGGTTGASGVTGFPLAVTVVGALALAACVALGLRRKWRPGTVSTNQRSAS
jgi:hypothetical protein